MILDMEKQMKKYAMRTGLFQLIIKASSIIFFSRFNMFLTSTFLLDAYQTREIRENFLNLIDLSLGESEEKWRPISGSPFLMILIVLHFFSDQKATDQIEMDMQLRTCRFESNQK